MKKLIAHVLLAAFGARRRRAGRSERPGLGQVPEERMTDMAALQNGAKLFVNYCLNCHAAAFMRYNRMRDIGLTEDEIKKNLMFATDKVGDTMTVALSPRTPRSGSAPCRPT
jgi:ubiquinol-cytochrome c reductase cytochrome c1 subunit